MKTLFLILSLILALATPALASDPCFTCNDTAGVERYVIESNSVIERKPLTDGGRVATYTWYWNGDANGEWHSGTSIYVTGYLTQAQFIAGKTGVSVPPAAGVTVPAVGYDVKVTDRFGIDLLQNKGANLNSTSGVTSYRAPLTTDSTRPMLVNEPIGVHVHDGGAGITPYGVVKLFVEE